MPLSAQVNPADTTGANKRPFGFQDTTTTFSDTASDKFNLSPDSVYATPVGDAGLLESMVEYTASDSIVGSIGAGLAFLYRDAYVKYGDLELKAGYIKIDFNKNEIYAEGISDTAGNIIQKPVFTESGKSYRADNMRYNFNTKKAKISKVITKEGDGFLHGEVVKKMPDNVFYVKNAAYTTCSHEHPHFNIKTPKAKVIPGDKVVTKFAYLEVLDVPTPLMVPFGFFPTTDKRKSGIIIPSYGSSEFRGYFLRNGGYYWAVNDYLDFTLTGDIYTQGGYAVQGATSYRKRYAYSGNFSVLYNRIKFGREEFQPFVPSAFQNLSDFKVIWSHSQDPKARPDFRFNSNVNVGSQNVYKVTSIEANEVLQNTLASSISLQKSFPGKPYNLSVSLNHSQNNRTKDVTLKLPQVTFTVNRQFPFKREVQVGDKKWYEEIGISYSANAQNNIQTKLGKPLFTETVFRDSSRNGIQHQIPISANYKVFKYFVLNPSVNYTERWYFNQLEYGYNDSLKRAMVVDTNNGFYGVRDFQASTNLSTKLYGLYRYRGFLKAIRHVATPTVGFSYRPDFSTGFWNYYQQVQTDSLGNTQRFNRYRDGIYGSAPTGKQGNVTFGLLNTLEAKVRDRTDSSGVKKVKLLERLSLNTAYNVAVDEFNWSPLNLTASSSAFDNVVSLNYTSIFDFYGYDEKTNKRVNKSAYEVNGKLLRPSSQSFALGLNLSSKRFKGKKKENQPPQGKDNDKKEGLIDELDDPSNIGVTSGDVDYYRQQGFVDFDIPWSMRLDYNLRKNYSGLESTVSQSFTVNGDFELTQNWRIGFRTGYDLTAKDFSYTSLDFYRDLHCWELRATWVPIGPVQSYTITVRVKSNVLSDLKLERRRGAGDYIPGR